MLDYSNYTKAALGTDTPPPTYKRLLQSQAGLYPFPETLEMPCCFNLASTLRVHLLIDSLSELRKVRL